MVLVVEVAALCGLGVVGWLLAGPGRGGVWRVLVALPLGIVAVTLVELLLLLTRMPIARPWTATAVTLAGTLAAAAVRRSRNPDDGGVTGPAAMSMARSAVIAVAVLLGVAALTAAVPLVNLTADSFRFLPSAHVLSTQGDLSGVSLFLLTTRGLAIPTLHGLAVTEFGYLRAVGPLLGVVTLGLLWWSVQDGTRSLDAGWARLLGVAAAALLVTNSRFLFSSFYLNAHVLFACLLLVLVVLVRSVLLQPTIHSNAPRTDSSGRDVWLIGLFAAGLALLRAEGALVAVLAVAPLVLDTETPRRHRQTTLVVFGAVVAAWQLGILLPRSLADPRPLDSSVVGLGLLGLAMVAAAPLLRVVVPRLPRPLLLIHVVVWLATVALALRDPRLVRDSAVATAQNVHDAGLWGVSLLVLAALLVLAVVLRRVPGERALVFPLATFVPLALLLAILRGHSYRVGAGDSLNRMLLHVVPVAILALALTAAGSPRWSDREDLVTPAT